MNLKELDLYRLSHLASSQVDHVTCLECCKYYIAPETAICGHTLCHGCWRGRRTCPSCSATLQRRDLKLNLPMQNLTEHVHALVEAFEKLFNIKLDDFNMDGAINEIHCDADPTKNVIDWLASSQNQFSAPTINSEPFINEISPVELSTSKIQVHTNSKKSKSPQKVIYVPPPQDDWDKIEKLPDTEEVCFNNKENLTHEKNKQPYVFEDEYSTDNPRRSSRKRDHNVQHEVTSKIEVTENVPSSKNSNSETEKKSNKAKQNWNNVKRMRKEFSKLNKKNRSKLNVSIEMCKKTQSKANIEPNQLKLINKDSQPATYTIEDNTPDINVNNNIDHVESAQSLQNDFTPFSNNREIDVVMTSAELITEKVPSDINKAKAQMYHVTDEKENNVTTTNNIVSEEGLATNIYESVNKKNPLINKNKLCPHCSEKNSDLEDIEITFKIGTMVTNITVKRKNNDVQLRVKADRGVQASLGTNTHVDKDNHCLITQNIDPQEAQINLGNKNASREYENILNKSKCTKKNTASADTATAQFEITESVEKDLSNVMDCADSKHNNKETDISKIQTDKTPGQDSSYDQYINDFDIFENESVIEQHVHLFNKSKQAPSEILMPTVKTKSQKHPNKRVRDGDDDEVLSAKKTKIVPDKIEEVKKTDSTLQPCQDSESTDYDAVIGQVFASIDADIGKTQEKAKNKQTTNVTTNDDSKVTMKSQYTEKIFQSQAKKDKFTPTLKSAKAYVNDKYSENIFSIIDKDDESFKENDKDVSTRRHIENLLTPGMCQDLISTNEVNMELINKEQCTPLPDNEDSDKSVVEETPQKNVSFPKPKNITDASKISKGNPGTSKMATSSQLVKSIINVSDTLVDTTKITKEIIDQEPVSKKTLETPLTINNFVNHIKHKSTPVARKSLNFDSENVDDIDPEQTLCPSTIAAKVTKEHTTKAFEQTPKSPVKKPLTKTHVKELSLKHCMAGSCLSNAELTNLQYLCVKYDWKYVDKYTNELTHLVVGVDEENRSQRSVKYMCALAASKWIISYEWVEACIKTNLIVGESLYEVLDGTGEPGPRRSRLASPKLFDGITFYCMPPFSVLDINTLKEMLAAAGGRVASDPRAVRAAPDAPALLLAEPEHTQEDKFVCTFHLVPYVVCRSTFSYRRQASKTLHWS